MSEPIFILAPNANAAKHARRVAADLSKLGFVVGGSDGRLRGAQLDEAHIVVLLWSGGAARGPALRAAARRAKANGKLVTVRVDATRPPAEAGRSVTLPRGRQTMRAWRRLLGPQSPTPTPAPAKLAPRKLATHAAPTRNAKMRRAPNAARAVAVAPAEAKRGAGPIAVLFSAMAALALIAAAVGAEAYQRDASFAARVNAMAGAAQLRAGEMVAGLRGS